MSIFIETLAIDTILRRWKENPDATKREIGVWSNWKEDIPENNIPLSEEYIQRYLDRLKELNPTNGLLKEQEVLGKRGERK